MTTVPQRAPFEDLDGNPLLTIELRQVGPKDFQLMKGFKWFDRTRNDEEHVVPPHDPANPQDNTDLASVPSFLWWFIASYGHHTAAALLHDHLMKGCKNITDRREADRLFRVALQDVKSGVFRPWIMWAAVSIQAMGKFQRRSFFPLMVAQVAAGIALMWLSFWIDLFDMPTWFWLVIPAAGSLLWLREFLVPLIGTYVGAFLLPATSFVLATILVRTLMRLAWWIVKGGNLPDGEGPFVKPYRVPGWYV